MSAATATIQAQRPGAAKTPTALARLALTELAQSGAPPTPENYARAYQRAAGLPDTEAEDRHAHIVAINSSETLLSLVNTIRLTSTGLLKGIERFDGDLNTIFSDTLYKPQDNVATLVNALSTSRLVLQKNLEHSHRELQNTRDRLEQVTDELERSRSQARIDPLTGTINRRGMYEIIEREISRTRRLQRPLSIAIMDIDHFKRVNDEHGHDTGDQALTHFVAVIKTGLRDSDVVCRFGGEEFAVILPDSATQRGLFVVDRLRTLVESTPVQTAAGPLQLCFSAGVAELIDSDERDSLIKRADNALLAAKRGGRNRVYVGQPAAAL